MRGCPCDWHAWQESSRPISASRGSASNFASRTPPRTGSDNEPMPASGYADQDQEAVHRKRGGLRGERHGPAKAQVATAATCEVRRAEADGLVRARVGVWGHDDTDAARHYSEAAGLPLRGYLVTLATCSGLVTALTVLARVTGSKAPACVAPGDVLLTAVATYKLSSPVTKDPVTRPLRAPFSSYEGTQGPSRALGVTARRASASSSPARSARRRGSARAWPPGSSSCGGRGARRWGCSPCRRERTFLQYAHAWLMQKAE